MTKTKKFMVFIVFVALALCAVLVSYAAYTSTADHSGSIMAKSFNTSNTVRQNIPIDIWLGETKYYYFEVQNCDDTGKVSKVDIAVNISVELKAYENRPFRGLILTIEEYVGESGRTYNSELWRNITSGVEIITEGVLEGKSINLFLSGQLTARQYRIKYMLPDTAENAKANGFYASDDITLLQVKSAVDIIVKINQNII